MAMKRPADWIAQVYMVIEEAEVNRLRLHIQRGRPFGTMEWTLAAEGMGLEQTLRDRGRPARRS